MTRGGAQTLRLQSPIDGTDRLGSAAPLKHFPGVIVATKTVAAALTDWREQTRFLVAAAALSASVVAAHPVPDHPPDHAAEPRSAATAGGGAASTRHRAEQHDPGPGDARPSGRVVTFNRRYIDMYGLSTEIVKPGAIARPDAASQGHRVVHRRHRRILLVGAGQHRQGPDRSQTMQSDDGRASRPSTSRSRRRLGGHDRRRHRTAQAGAGTRPQPGPPERDHRPHPVPDHGEGRP